MSEAERRTLEILREHGPLRPRDFAHKYFPRDHPGWGKPCKCGRGVHAGGGLVLWAGGWLGRLARKGVVRRSFARHGPVYALAAREAKS